YLQQDLVRQFLESDSPHARFNVVSELVGSGRLVDFQKRLESDRNAWSRGRSSVEADLQDAELTVQRLEDRLHSLPSEPIEGLDESWADWWRSASAVLNTEQNPAFEPSESLRVLGNTI